MKPAANKDRGEGVNLNSFLALDFASQFWVVIGVCHVVPLVMYIRAGMNQDHFQYLPFLYASIGYLFHQRWDGIVRLPQRVLSRLFLAAGLATMLAAALLGSTWLAGISFALNLTSFLSSNKERSGLPLTYLAVVLLLSVRLPLARTAAIVTRLQITVTEMSANVLDGLGVPNATEGTLIQLPSKDLLVAEACSGIQSLFTILFFALLLIAYHRRKCIYGALLITMAVFIAIFGNAVRILAIAIAEYLFRFDLSVGWVHSVLGYVALAFAAALLIACDDLLSCLVPKLHSIGISRWRKRWPAFRRDAPGLAPVTSSVLKHRAATGVLILFPVCGLAMIGHVLMRSSRPRASFDEHGIFVNQDTSRGIISSVGMQPVAHSEVRNGTASEDDRLGKNADVFQCRLMGVPGQLVVSQPYVGWHELTYCYRAIGWSMSKRLAYFSEPDEPPVIYATFVNENSQHGLLAFTGLNADGTVPQTYGGMSRVERWFSPFISIALDDPTETEGEPQTAMVQYWSVTDQPMSDSQIANICERVAETRKQMQTSLKLEEAT